MKKSMLLAFVAAIAIPSSALALAPMPRKVCVGPFDAPAGIVLPLFLGQPPIGDPAYGTCAYQLDWQSPLPGFGLSVLCDVFEQRAVGHTSCLYNSLSDFATIVSSKPNCCQGYDYFGAVQPVTLTLSELGNGALSGTACYAQWPFPQAIKIIP